MGSGVSRVNTSIPALFRISHRLATPEARSVWTAAVSQSGKILVCATGDFMIRIWSLERFEQVHVIQAHDDAIWSVVFSPDDKLIVSSSADGKVCVIDARSGVIRHTIRCQSNWVWSTAFSKDSSLLACGGTDTCLYLYRTEDFQLSKVQQLHDKSISKILFSNQDLSRVITASYDGTIAVFDVQSDELIVRLEGHVGGVSSLAINPHENHFIASGGDDGSVRLWDLRDLTVSMAERSRRSLKGVNFPHHLLKGHMEKVTSVAFNFSAELLVSASQDATVRIWMLPQEYRDHVSGYKTAPTQFGVISVHSAWVQTALWLGRNNSAILTVSTDGTMVAHAVDVQFWKDQDGRQVKVCKRDLVTDTTFVERLKHS